MIDLERDRANVAQLVVVLHHLKRLVRRQLALPAIIRCLYG